MAIQTSLRVRKCFSNTEIVQGELYKSYGFNFYVPAVVDIYE